jgi:O-acetyl-ADP-ribose deacetylase (regulator of RNase III)
MISIPSPAARQEALTNLRHGLVFAKPFLLPSLHVHKNGYNIRLWVAQRRMPFLLTAVRHQAVLVPVAPDLKMIFGIAKRVRDYGGDKVQREAAAVAPLPPGEAFIGSGSRYRFANTVLAVIFDESKRTSPDIITRAIRRGCELANQRGCHSIVLPDLTENLLAQPNWITDQQRRNTAEIAALTMGAALRATRGLLQQVNVWCWDPRNADVYLRELKRL